MCSDSSIIPFKFSVISCFPFFPLSFFLLVRLFVKHYFGYIIISIIIFFILFFAIISDLIFCQGFHFGCLYRLLYVYIVFNDRIEVAIFLIAFQCLLSSIAM